MTNPINKECIQLGRTYPNMSTDDIINLFKLRKLTLKYHSYCERYCNEEGFNEKLIESQREKIKKCIKDFSVSFPIEIEEIQNDPRGWAVQTNNYFVNYLINAK